MSKKKDLAAERLLALRKEFRLMPFDTFCAIVWDLGRDCIYYQGRPEDLEALRAILQPYENQARVQHEHERAELRKIGERLTASMLHRQIRVVTPHGIDAEHVQAILAYGFLSLSSQQRFIGKNKLPLRHVREDVQSKLGVGFNIAKYNDALHFLVQNGVIFCSPLKDTEKLASLNLNEKHRRVTKWGLQIIQRLQKLLQDWKRNGG